MGGMKLKIKLNSAQLKLELGLSFRRMTESQARLLAEFATAKPQQVLVRSECVRQRNKVAIKQGIITLSFFLSLHTTCSKPHKGLSYEFKVLMGGREEGLKWADPGARTPIGARGIFKGYF